MKIAEILNEGVWSAPQTVDDATELAELFRKPIPANRAPHLLYNLVGDDNLYDAIAEWEEDDPKSDVRPLVALHLERWMKNLDNDGWKRPWKPEALSIVKKLVKRFHPYQ